MSYRARLLCGVVVVALVVGAGCGADGGSGGSATDPPAPSDVLSVDEFAAFLEDHPDVPLVNVHVPYEGHIAGTDAFVRYDRIASWHGLPGDRTAPIAIYCRSGSMSAVAAASLADLGYTNVVDLEGGMNAWTDAGHPLLTSGGP